jgi:hypothetical protein
MMFRRAMVRRIAQQFANTFYSEIDKVVDSKLAKMGFVMVVLKHKSEESALELLEYRYSFRISRICKICR